MNCFSFFSAPDADAAIEAKSRNSRAAFIAGGTNILDLMKENVSRHDTLIDINRTGYNDISETPEGGVFIGALATNADTAYHSLIETRYPLLSHAILAAASPQIRNMASNGGNLLQRTRCYYFYDTATPCNKRTPGEGCSAIQGFNRNLAILGTSEHCIATHPSDMCVALAALGAQVLVRGAAGQRYIPFSEFHKLPEDTPHIDTTLADDEMILGIELPAMGFAANYKYLKVRDRASYAFALVSVAAAFELQAGVIKEARIALGGVAHKPWRDNEAEAFLSGKLLNDENVGKAADIILREARGFGANDFKIKLARRALLRACRDAAVMGGSL